MAAAAALYAAHRSHGGGGNSVHGLLRGVVGVHAVAVHPARLEDRPIRLALVGPTRIDPSAQANFASAKPADVDFLFYVVKPGTCGEHAFSSTDAEFARDQQRYNVLYSTVADPLTPGDALAILRKFSRAAGDVPEAVAAFLAGASTVPDTPVTEPPSVVSASTRCRERTADP